MFISAIPKTYHLKLKMTASWMDQWRRGWSLTCSLLELITATSCAWLEESFSASDLLLMDHVTPKRENKKVDGRRCGRAVESPFYIDIALHSVAALIIRYLYLFYIRSLKPLHERAECSLQRTRCAVFWCILFGTWALKASHLDLVIATLEKCLAY